jgi:hypothetical protein
VSSSEIISAASRISPPTSMGAVRAGPPLSTSVVVVGGARNPTVTPAKTANGTASRNSDCQPKAPTRTPPTNGAIAALIETSMSNRPKAVPRRPGGASARTSATEVVEISAPLSAWRTRASVRTANDGASAAISDEIAKATTPTRNTRRCP